MRKGWKKVKDNVVDFLWEKRSASSYHGNYEIWVYKGKVNNKPKWIFKFREVGGGHFIRTFKTKTEALKYARAYMRKH